jgi:V/A-type H+-transporting ATPase subunit G/H
VQNEIINEVLSIEERAQRIIRESEETARKIIADAQAEANESLRAALKEQRDHAHQSILQAQEDAALALEEYEATLNVDSSVDEKILDTVASLIVKRVCTTDVDAGADEA